MNGIAAHREHLLRIFEAAIGAVHPSLLMPKVLAIHEDRVQLGEEIVPLHTFKKIYVAGAGKATGAMAVETERILGELITDGVVAVKDFPGSPLKYIRPIVAGHPLPDANSVIAGKEMINLLQGAGSDDLVIFLLSGGASSLLTDLPEFCTLHDINHLFHLLIHSGASISEINTVRKHLSYLKGGNLVKQTSATVVTFIISDVPGNDLQVIGSGPTVPDDTTFDEAIAVLRKYELYEKAPASIIQHLEKGAQQNINDNPHSGDKIFKRCRNYLVGDIQMAMKAAADAAEQFGYRSAIYEKLLEGDTERTAAYIVEQFLEDPGTGKKCLIAGGETTVHVTGSGKGGRNQHFALAAFNVLKSCSNTSLLAAGTDGSDGTTDAAGALVDVQTLQSAQQLHLQPDAFLANHDAYHFFELTSSLVKTGPTHTNVMDLVILLRD